jgi:GNAT superfamily N-acetyltransferase
MHLRPMTQAEYDTTIGEIIEGYAEQNVTSGRWTAEDALEKSRQATDALLPKGMTSDGHHFFVMDENGAAAGYLWVNIDASGSKPQAFIYDIEVRDNYRRRGFARQSLIDLEAWCAGRGVVQMSLHVFSFNTGAISLYEQAGYRTTDLVMSKNLREGSDE